MRPFPFITLLALLCQPVLAHDHRAGHLQIGHPWALALPDDTQALSVYFMLYNHGKQDDRLLGANSPAATRAELHTHIPLGKVLRMQKVDSVGIPASGKARFGVGGNHVMLFGLNRPLVAGEHLPLTLEFENAGKVEVEVSIETDLPPHEHPH